MENDKNQWFLDKKLIFFFKIFFIRFLVIDSGDMSLSGQFEQEMTP